MAFYPTINTGTTPEDGKGDGLRTNMRKLIANDNHLKSHIAANDNTISNLKTDVTAIRSELQVYKKDIIVNGDPDKFYMVVIHRGNQYKLRTLKVHRALGDKAPYEWNNSNTHKGSLLLDIFGNFGGWGGVSYDWGILSFQHAYTTQFAQAGHCNHYMAFYLMLRGGGAIYHMESNQHLNNVKVYYSSQEKIFSYPKNSIYDRYALDPLTSVNTTLINSKIVKKGI